MMKYFVITAIIITFVPQRLLAQSDNHNYTVIRKMINGYGTSVTSVQYYNGFGYPTVMATTTGTDGSTAYTLTTYDGKLRKERLYLPTVSGTSLGYKSPEDIANASSAFHSDGYAYTQNNYDALDRVIQTDQPGSDWRNNSRNNGTAYSANTADDMVQHYEAPCSDISLKRPEQTAFQYYQPGTLRKEESHDADGKTVTTFINTSGEKILERTAAGDTYYVYNDLGQLRYVLTPKYQSDRNKGRCAYEYRYDYRGRIVKKILSGCEYIQYWYDKADRLLYMQDATLRSKGRYRFMLYDVLGRLCVQGLCTECRRGSTLTPTVRYDAGTAGVCGTGYALPAEYASNLLTNPTLETVNYYDRYCFLTGSGSGYFGEGMSPDFSDTQEENMAGYLTGTVTAMSDGGYASSVQWNDIRGNVLGSKTKYPCGIMESEAMGYTFTDKVSWHERFVDGLYGGTITMVENNYYSEVTDDIVFKEILLDHGGEDTDITIGYGYDQLGRLTTVSRPVANGMATLYYTYDMRGWTKKISTSEGFFEKLYYQDGSGTACYNGNISSMTWRNSTNTGLTRGYAYTYDNAGRLTHSIYGEGSMLLDNRNRYNEYMTYDNNGNVTKLHRCGKMQKGTYGNVDKLTTMEYSGNQLTAIKETADAVTAEGSTDYKGEKNRLNLLRYNGCGSLIRDDGRGIALIEYDNMNNPIRIQFTNGNVTRYVYTVTGRKLKAVHQTAVPNITVAAGTSHELTAGEMLYADSVEYLHDGRLTVRNGRIDKYHFDGGYAQATAAQTESQADNFEFHYYTADHLGNIREVLSEDGTVEQVTNYYPFGTPYSAEDAATLSPTLQKRKYNGKEFDSMHGLSTYDYGARQYCALFARWDRMDPMCEKYYSVSPYVYCLGNPVKNLDEKGEEVKVYVGSCNNPNNKNLYSLGTRLAAHDNPNAIMIVAHGIYAHEDDYGMSNGIRFEAYNPHTKSWKNTDIRNGEEMDRFLSANSNVWKDVKEGKKEASDIQIVLYSCGAGDIAKKISAFPKFEGVTFIAPNDKVSVAKNASNVSVRHLSSKGLPHYGNWNIYREGTIQEHYDGNKDLLPGTLNFTSNEWRKIWGKR